MASGVCVPSYSAGAGAPVQAAKRGAYRRNAR